MPARRATLLSAALVVTAAAAGCSSSGPAGSRPAGSSSNADEVRLAKVTITGADGCVLDRNSYRAGAVTFKITNRDATIVSEVELLRGARIVGEKENVPAGFTGEFTVTLTAGRYTLFCPGADPKSRTFAVTGRANAAHDQTITELLKAATTGYARYVSTQVRALLAASQKVARALHGTDLAAAQRAYIAARPFYERIEPVAESFVVGTDSIDADIDARAGDVPTAKWRGFHRIERALFQQNSLAGMAGYGDKLVSDVRRLLRLTTGLNYQPTELANGAQELLDEVAASKITGEEERYSRIDVLDIADNIDGAEQAFARLEPALGRIDVELAGTVGRAFTALNHLVDRYRTSANPSGFVLYGELTVADKTRLAAAVKAVQEPLSRVASKVANS